MKKVISVLLAFTLVGVMAFAQGQKGHAKKNGNKNDWREKVRAEQVAFITSELDLTEAEAQAFWPVYNEVQAKRREAFKASADAFKALQEGADGENAAALLDAYLSSKKAGEAFEADAVKSYQKVLPVNKVAKLLVAEEKFRHQQIGKLGKGQGGPQGPGRPGGRGGNKPAPVPEA